MENVTNESAQQQVEFDYIQTKYVSTTDTYSKTICIFERQIIYSMYFLWLHLPLDSLTNLMATLCKY